MKPLLEIHVLKPQLYAYSVRAGMPVQESPLHYESAFDSLASCLRDAGDLLGHYFPTVQMNFNGQPLCQCSSASLRDASDTMAQYVFDHVASGHSLSTH